MLDAMPHDPITPASLDLETFNDAAFTEIQAAPYWTPGICFNPICSRPFNPKRAWQKYCCKACKDRINAEFRAFSDWTAVPLFVHRIGKYDRTDPDVMARTAKSRTYIGQVQSAWINSHKERLAIAQGRG